MNDFRFSCPNCGQHFTGDASWSGRSLKCPTCQQHILVPPSPGNAAAVPTPAPTPTVRPVRVPTVTLPPGAPPAPAARPVPTAPSAARGGGSTPGVAIASLCLGIASLFLGFLTGIPAVICGHATLRRIRAGRAVGGKGLAVAGLVMGYALSLLSLAFVAFAVVAVLRVRAQFAEAMQNPPPGMTVRVTRGPGQSVGPMEAANGATPDEPAVATDPATVDIPATPAAGTVRDQRFQCEKATLQSGILTLRQGKDFFADLEVKVFLFLTPGEKLDGKSYRIVPGAAVGSPHVYASKRQGQLPDTKSLTDGYVLRLEFGQAAAKGIPGKIYLELPKSYGTTLAGTFTAETN